MELVPSAMASGGDAVARDPQGKAVFVRGALPGERVRVKVRREHATYAVGSVDALIEASPHRVTPPCPEVERGCGACPWQHIAIETQRQLKTGFMVDAVERAGLRLPGSRTDRGVGTLDFRTTIDAAVRGGPGRAAPGAVAPGRARRDVSGGPPSPRGTARRGPLPRRPPGPPPLRGPHRGTHGGDHPVGPGRRPPRRRAIGVLSRKAAGRAWRVSARSFFQSRADGADALAAIVECAADELGAPSTAVDLYSGVGLFAGVLAARGWRVTAVEGSHSAASDAEVNLQGLDATVQRVDVTKWSPTSVDLVVADPSRIGLRHDGVDAVAATGARRVILVSCDAAGLGRDAKLLDEAGYRLTAVTLVDLFPHTFRVEAVTVYDRMNTVE